MDKEEFISELKTIVTPYTQEPEALDHISEDTDFIKDLKINSANLVDVVLDVEEKFGIEIDNDAMARMLTVRAAIEIIEDKLAASGRE
ncbi:acyl carrier protein [Pedobacter westerhofensis]|uniref:Acyl carrier protein n=1 Tax=Pedobacter westerhofensis TaxID=425512 RepID=A0A521AP03_9SPHI|nr:phosphopantetheine-binding protein [Pedobacter westerhofensis]SMO36481.1 acyl carrier protein [Pedobacter westerhofensis]